MSNMNVNNENRKEEEKLNVSEENSTEENQENEEAKNNSNAKKYTIIGAICVIIILLGIWLWGKDNYSKKFLSGTKINQIDVSDKKPDEVAEMIRSNTESPTLEVSNPDKTVSKYSYKEMGGKYLPEEQVKKLLNDQDTNLWFIPTNKNLNINANYIFDRAVAIPLIQEKINTHIPKVDLTNSIEFDGDNQKFKLKTGANDKSYSKDALVSKIYNSLIEQKSSIDLFSEGSQSKELKDLINNANKVLASNIEIKYGDDVETIDKSMIINWVGINKDGISIDIDALGTYLAQLSDKHNHKDENKKYEYNTRELVNLISENIKSGVKKSYIAKETITEIEKPKSEKKDSDKQVKSDDDKETKSDDDKETKADDKEVSLNDKKSEDETKTDQDDKNKISDVSTKDSEKKKTNENVEPEYSAQWPFCKSKKPGTFVDVSKDTQTLCAYKDGKVVFGANVVTGDHSKGRDTPSGTWSIWNKEMNKTLDGSTVGTGNDYSYKIPVKYWMPIDNTGVGLHSIDPDEVTRSHGRVYWGNDAYLTGRGSHGCINMHTSDAGWIYNNMPLNTMVVVH